MKLQDMFIILGMIMLVLTSCTEKTTEVNKCSTPTFNPPQGSYIGEQEITISCATINSSIVYTIDGSEPNSNSQIYSSPIILQSGTVTTIKAQAFREGWDDSGVANAVFTLAEKVLTPSFSISSGTFTNEIDVEIQSLTPNSIIKYAIDGSEPNISSDEYTNPIRINTLTTLKAKAYKDGFEESTTASAQYSFMVSSPIISPNSGTYHADQSVEITCATVGASIFYTTDGSNPTITSQVYTTPIQITISNTIVKAIARKIGFTDSPLTSETYYLKVTTPTFNYPDGQYTNPITVSISTTTPNSIIRFTTNGTNPTEVSVIYTNPITIISSTVIKARAYKNNWIPSDIAIANYLLQE